MSRARSMAVAATLALLLPASAHASEPGGEPAAGPKPGWEDDAPIAPAPAPPTMTAPAPAAPAPMPAPAPPSERQRRAGNGMWIGAAVTAGLATLFNGWRASIVSGPCQTHNPSAGCEAGWVALTPLTWGLNVGSIALAGAGGGLRGRYDAAADPERHAQRRSSLATLGATMLVFGFVANVTVRSLWLSDWLEPRGPEIFDFARRSHAFGYYGSLQVSSSMIAVGLATLVHATRRPARMARHGGKRRATVLVMPSGTGLQLVGRF